MFTCGFTCETMLKVTLKCVFSARSGMSVRSEPSFHLWPKEKGVIVKGWCGFLVIRTTGLRMPGTAAEARTAEKMQQSGAVR